MVLSRFGLHGSPVAIKTKENNLKFKIILKKDGFGFHGYIPKIKGLHTYGKTIEEVLLNVGNALSAYMKSLIEHREKLER